MSVLHDVDEYFPNRNAIRIGDTVKCQPLRGSRFPATVRRIKVDEYGAVHEVEVFGAEKPKRASHIRTFTPDRISRVAQSRIENREG